MEVWNNRLLVAEGDWRDVGKAADSVRKLLIQRLVENSAVPVEHGITYWRSVGTRNMTTASLFYLQQSPIWITRSLLNIRNITGSIVVPQLQFWKEICPKLSALKPGEALKRESADIKAHIADSPFQHLNRILSSFVAAKRKFTGVCLFVVVQVRNLKNWYVSAACKLSNENITELAKTQKRTTELIGDLLTAASQADLTKESEVKQMIADMSSAVLGPANSKRPQNVDEALWALQTLLEKSTQDTSAQGVRVLPGFLTRYWPAIILLVFSGWKLAGSWDDLVRWVDMNVFNTVEMFWKNWLVDPLLQIYKTIRHDESSQVALIAKESLSSDINSLERMVVDFARDTNPRLTSAELSEIGAAASRGNVTPVMSVYEKQLGSPISSALTGKLIRTLLIQVQKGKVDLEVALSGIDQLLQSQQLVFGLVAAFPAIATIFWLLHLSTSGLWSSAARKGQVRRWVIDDILLTLDKTIQSAPDRLQSSDIGTIYSCVYLIRAEFEGHNSISQTRLIEQLDRLQTHAIATRNTHTVLADLDRAYNRYYLTRN